MFGLKEPDQKIISEATAAHTEHKAQLKNYFIGSNKFIGGDEPSIADLLVACTLQQSALSSVNHEDFGDYVGRVREVTDITVFDELEGYTRGLFTKMKML